MSSEPTETATDVAPDLGPGLEDRDRGDAIAGATEPADAPETDGPHEPEKSLERQIRAFHWVRLLAELSGRHAGTDQEGEAGRRVAVWLGDLGLEEISLASVPSRPRPGTVLAMHAGVAALGCAIGGIAGFALAVFSLISFRREVGGGAPLLTRWLPARDSQNVIGRVGAVRPRRRIVLLAHLDAGQASPLFTGRARRWLAASDASGAPRGAWALPARVLFAATVVTAASALGADGALVGLAQAALALTLGVGFIVGVQWALDRDAAGANDNASGVAAMLTAVEQLAAQIPPDVELWCAATGAGQAGAQGVRALLDAHPEWQDDHTAIVSFDCVGEGTLCHARSDGALVRATHSPMLGELARRVAASGAYGDVAPADLAFETAAHVPARRGAHVLSLVTLDADGLPHRWRAAGDTPERVDAEAVIRAADFGCCVLSAYLRGDAEPLAYV